MARFWRESHDRTQCNALYTNYSVVQACWSDTPKSRSVEQSMQAMRHNFGIRLCCHIVVRHFWSDWSGFLISFTGQALVQGSRTQSGKKVPHRGTLLGIGTSKNAENIWWNYFGPQQLAQTHNIVSESMFSLFISGPKRRFWHQCKWFWMQECGGRYGSTASRDYKITVCKCNACPPQVGNIKHKSGNIFIDNLFVNFQDIWKGTLIIWPEPQNNRWQFCVKRIWRGQIDHLFSGVSILRLLYELL